VNSLEQNNTKIVPRKFSLYVIRLDNSTHTARLLSELPVGEYGARELTYYSDDLVLDYRTLYLLLPSEVVVFDVSDDQQPRLLTKSTYQALYQGKEKGKESWITIPLPTDNALSEEQRYRIAQYFARKFGDWEGNRYARTENDFIRVYEVKEVSPEKIRLEKIAERKLLPLEKLLTTYPPKIILRGDKLYSLFPGVGLTIYHFDESAGTLKNIGHYAGREGQFHDMSIRDDGRIVLIGYRQIHIVEPPPVIQGR
jgi:hypothetical protein